MSIPFPGSRRPFGWSVFRYTFKQLYNLLSEGKKILNSGLDE